MGTPGSQCRTPSAVSLILAMESNIISTHLDRANNSTRTQQCDFPVLLCIQCKTVRHIIRLPRTPAFDRGHRWCDSPRLVPDRIWTPRAIRPNPEGNSTSQCATRVEVFRQHILRTAATWHSAPRVDRNLHCIAFVSGINQWILPTLHDAY